MPTANVNTTHIHYEISGQGEPLLLLPGLGLDKTYYRFGIPILSRFLKIVAVDPRGVGQSDKTKCAYTAELWADDFAALIDHLDLGEVHVLGSSLGGATAMSLADRYPGKVRSLTVVGGFCELDRGIAANMRLRLAIISKLGMNEEIAAHMGLWTLSREFMETQEGAALMEANKTAVKKNPADLYMAMIESVLRWGRLMPGQEGEPKFTERLDHIKCASLVVSGDDDHFIPARHSKLIASRIPGAKYAEIPGGGHIPFIQKPRETCQALLGFLCAVQ